MRTMARVGGGVSVAWMLASAGCVIDDAASYDGVGGAGAANAGIGGGGAGGSAGNAGHAGENFPPPPPPPVCGDALIRGSEGCDDSNTVSGDGCDAACQVEPDWVCPPSEACRRLYGDQACSADACSHGVTCIERGSRLGCRCPDVSPPACEKLHFRALGLLPESTTCAGTDVSGDGSTVIGRCSRYEMYAGLTQQRAFRWSASTGTRDLGLSPEKPSEPIAISLDGSTILAAEFEQLYGGGHVLRITPDGISVPEIDASSLSADGSVLAGTLTTRADAGTLSIVPARLTPAGVSLLSTAGLDGDLYSFAISADGSVIVGTAKAGGAVHAVRWDSDAVSVLPAPDGAVDSEARAVSGDGSVIVGTAYFSDQTTHLLRWTVNGVEDLGPGYASDVSADGSVIVAGPQIWDAVNGLRRFDAILAAAGTDLTGRTELYATAMSSDGKVVIGESQYPAPGASGFRAFIIWLP